MAEIPHFATPFRIVGTAAVTVEQDSDEDVLGCVEAILRTEVGSRDELPEFGVDELAFHDGETVETEVIDAIREWEPRVATSVSTEEIEDMIMRVEAEIE